ncbi:MAG TPA: 2'-5' RNA ligase family protein [Nevskiaceae bacterium]|nr:2'-5' RNA ligase family protein [Nevskiaceae bacterium]
MNAEFSDGNATVLNQLTQEIKAEFGAAVFCMPKLSLHITLLDWISPLIDYDGRDKDQLFKELQPSYDRAITEIFAQIHPITIHITELKMSPSTLYLVGHDNGEFQKIRQQFLDKVTLPPGAKLPPQIVHSSLARFTKSIPLDRVAAFVAGKKLSITQQINDFRLMRTTKEPTLEFEILKRYKLSQH